MHVARLTLVYCNNSELIMQALKKAKKKKPVYFVFLPYVSLHCLSSTYTCNQQQYKYINVFFKHKSSFLFIVALAKKQQLKPSK